MKAFLVGFPKSGTSTIQKAFVQSGLRSVHWQCPLGYIGEVLYENHYFGQDPLITLRSFDAITQADVCLPSLNKNFWPNLDFGLLAAIRRHHPNCLFILNWRDPAATASSISRWGDMQDRFTISDIPGLPRGYGGKAEELIKWIESHHEAARIFFKDSNFLELDIAAPNAQARLSQALGTPIIWWGQENVNSPTPVSTDATTTASTPCA